MVKLRRSPLPHPDAEALASYQAGLEGAKRNSPAILTAWRRFTADGAVRQRIADYLRSHSSCKCMYCENPSATTFAHYYPKMKYPNLTFEWDNLLWACFPCNLAKRNDFPLQGRQRPLFLNPMVDDPATYFVVNLDSGWLSPRPGLSRAEANRAKATIRQYKLNRVDLPERRRMIARHLLRHLAAYMQVPVSEVEELVVTQLSPAGEHRAVIRQIMCRPSKDIKPLVDYCLSHSDRVQQYIRDLNWLI